MLCHNLEGWDGVGQRRRFKTYIYQDIYKRDIYIPVAAMLM